MLKLSVRPRVRLSSLEEQLILKFIVFFVTTSVVNSAVVEIVTLNSPFHTVFAT